MRIRTLLTTLAAGVLTAGSLAFSPAAQADEEQCDVPGQVIVGDNMNNVIFGTPYNDVIFGLGGNDLIFGLGGADVIYAGDGDDTVHGGDCDDVMNGQQGDDRLDGQNGANDTGNGGPSVVMNQCSATTENQNNC